MGRAPLWRPTIPPRSSAPSTTKDATLSATSPTSRAGTLHVWPKRCCPSYAALVDDWLNLLHAEQVDFTLAWRRLAEAATGNDAPLRALFADPCAPDAWVARWRARCDSEDVSAEQGSEMGGIERTKAMRSVNPNVIARNHRVEEALAAASDEGDLAPFERLLDALKRPYDEAQELAAYTEPAPAAVTACYRTFCGT